MTVDGVNHLGSLLDPVKHLRSVSLVASPDEGSLSLLNHRLSAMLILLNKHANSIDLVGLVKASLCAMKRD